MGIMDWIKILVIISVAIVIIAIVFVSASIIPSVMS